MTYRRSQASVARKSGAARRQNLIVAVLLLTAGLPGAAFASSTASADSATVTIRVSVAPVYGLTRSSHGPFLGDSEAKLCLRTNVALPTLPVMGEWRGSGHRVKIVLPSCRGLPSPMILAEVMEDRPSEGGSLLVSPE